MKNKKRLIIGEESRISKFLLHSFPYDYIAIKGKANTLNDIVMQIDQIREKFKINCILYLPAITDPNFTYMEVEEINYIRPKELIRK